MKRAAITFLLASFVLVGCSQTEPVSAPAKEVIETPSPTPTDTPTPEPSPVKEESAEKQNEIADIDITSDEWMLLEFKKPDAQIPVPSYVKDWEHVFPDEKQHSYDFQSKDGVHLRVDTYYLFENTEPENDDEYKKSFEGVELVELSHKDHLLKEYFRNNGEDKLSARFWGNGYVLSFQFNIPEGKTGEYREVYDLMAQYLSKVDVKTYHIMTEEEMIERCKELSGAPIVEIDDIIDPDEYLIRCYEQIGEGDEYHEPTWAWYRVNPVERTAIDDVMGEEVKGFFE